MEQDTIHLLNNILALLLGSRPSVMIGAFALRKCVSPDIKSKCINAYINHVRSTKHQQWGFGSQQMWMIGQRDYIAFVEDDIEYVHVVEFSSNETFKRNHKAVSMKHNREEFETLFINYIDYEFNEASTRSML